MSKKHAELIIALAVRDKHHKPTSNKPRYANGGQIPMLKENYSVAEKIFHKLKAKAKSRG